MKLASAVFRRAEQWLSILFFFLLPTQLGYYFWPDWAYFWGIKIDFLSPAVFLTDLLLICLLLISLCRLKLSLSFKKDQLISWLTLLVLVINVVFSFSRMVSFYRLLKIIEWFLVIIYWRKHFRPQLLVALFAGLLLVSLLSWWQFIIQSSVGGVFWWLGERAFSPSTLGIAKINLNGQLLVRPMATFSHPNSLAGFVLISLLILFRFRDFLTKLLGRFFYWGWGFIASSLLISFSSAVWLGILAAAFLLADRKISPSRVAVFSFLLIIMTILLSWGGLIDQHSLSERVGLLTNANNLFVSRPFWGWGLGSFIPAQQELSFSRFDFNYYQPVHNLLALILAQTGLIGLMVVIYWLAWWWSKTTWFYHRLLVVILVLGCFDHYWLTLQQNFLLLAVMIATALWSKKPGKNNNLEVI